jgi:uncharacterized LabA/DUF88 family protein
LVPERVKFYEYLRTAGYVLVFKQTIFVGEKVKCNCDAEIVLRAMSDYYEQKFDSSILITGDGDFGCLIEFLKNKNAIKEVIAPDKRKCSILIRNKDVRITFLNDLYHKFSNEI